MMSGDADYDKDVSVAGAQRWHFALGMIISAYIDGALLERWYLASEVVTVIMVMIGYCFVGIGDLGHSCGMWVEV